MVTLIIKGRLDGLNEYTKACRTNRYAGAQMKKKNEDWIKSYIFEQLPEVHFKGKVYIEFAWYEASKKRDLDNICFAKKFILDALVRAGTITADSWKGVYGFIDSFYIDAANPRVEVYISEYKGGYHE